MGWPPLPEVIDTSRLRPWRLGDVDDVLRVRSGRGVVALSSPAASALFPGPCGAILRDRTTHPAWAISLEGSVIGGINLGIRPEHRLCEMGYAIARDHWNRGFCTEAARAVVDTAFEALPDLNRIRAMADVGNTGSQRVMEKVGMMREGVLRQNRIERDQPIDEAWFGILRVEWRGPHPPRAHG